MKPACASSRGVLGFFRPRFWICKNGTTKASTKHSASAALISGFALRVGVIEQRSFPGAEARAARREYARWCGAVNGAALIYCSGERLLLQATAVSSATP